MELVSGYRDPLIEFSETMAQWYRSFQTTRTIRDHKEHLSAYRLPKCPQDSSPYWILHRLDCTVPPPAAACRLQKAGIDPSDLRSCDGQSILMVSDASGLPLGFDLLDRGWSSCLGGADQAGGDGAGAIRTLCKMVALLRRCMEAPMTGGPPRRPRGLRVNDRILHRLMHWHTLKQGKEILDMKLWPLALGGWEPLDLKEEEEEEEENQQEPPAFSIRWPPTRYCHVCKKRSFPTQLKPCPQCKVVLYCSDQCFQADRSRSPTDANHEHWCAKLASYMDHGAQLADLPFSYAAEATSEHFSLEDFLLHNKLLGGYWLHWSLQVRSPRSELPPAMEQPRDPYSLWLAGHSDAYGPLKKEAAILLCDPEPPQPPSPNKPLASWRQYYEWRGLSLSSPVAPLLSSALSIYYIITSLVPKHFPELNILKKQSLKIHIIESYREFHTLLTFLELSVLLPHVTFELVFIGEGLPSWSDEKQLFMQRTNGSVTLADLHLTPHQTAGKRSIRVKGYRRAYHMLQGPKPDLVIGFKPAIPLHESWLSTLPRLQSLRVPAYFCERSELSCGCSQQVMNQATGGAVSSAIINPFHCPLRINQGDNRLPWYSNGFIFHLMYKPAVNNQRPAAAANPDTLPVKPASPPPEKLTRKERKAAARNLPRKRR